MLVDALRLMSVLPEGRFWLDFLPVSPNIDPIRGATLKSSTSAAGSLTGTRTRTEAPRHAEAAACGSVVDLYQLGAAPVGTHRDSDLSVSWIKHISLQFVFRLRTFVINVRLCFIILH